MSADLNALRSKAWAMTDRSVAAFVAMLAEHSLAEIRCDHDTQTDVAVCNCGRWVSAPEATVQDAKEAWALHVVRAWQALRGGDTG